MKFRGIVICFFLLVNGILFSQKDTIWFDAEWNLKPKDSAVFKRITVHKEIRFKDYYNFTDYDSLGVKIKEGISLSKNKDIFEGEVIYYEEGTFVSERVLYRNGEPYGAHKIYYKSGKLKSLRSYVFGVLSGPSKTYYESGSLLETGAYSNNAKNGVWKVYYPNRKLKEQGLYKDDNRVGVWKVYYYNGTSQE